MPLTSLDSYIAAPKQEVTIFKTASRTAVALIPFGVFDLAGSPGAGTLAVGNTANGVVPTDATAGYPTINAFQASAKGYIATVDFASSVACRLAVYDVLFAAGAYAFNANVTLASQPSFSSRVPGGTDFKGLEIWIEAVTAFTGNQTITVTYTNQDGTTGRSTGAIATGVAPIAGRMLRLPLQAGDTGVQAIETVVSSVSTVGTFNVYVMRPIWSAGRVRVANDADAHGLDKTGMVELFENSALKLVVTADSTATGLPEVIMQVFNVV